jgi:hypothetical protein
MAKEKRSSEPRGEHSLSRDGMVKKGDILTASSGVMEPRDFSKGYGPNDTELLGNKGAGRKLGGK